MSDLIAAGRRANRAPRRNPFLRLAAALTLAAVAPLTAAPLAAAPVVQAAQPIEEGMFVTINGVEQWITIRGRDRSNPVLLILHGGPGMGLSNVAPFFAEWEKHYTIVQWDQPGSGATHARNIGRDIGPLNVARYTKDGIAVTEYIRRHLGVDKVALLGYSWGSMLGVEMVQSRPELFSAFIGSAQVVDGPKGTLLGYQLALEAARKRGDTAGVSALEAAGPPPYTSMAPYMVRQQYAMTPPPAEAAKAGPFMQVAFAPPPAGASYVPQGLPSYDVMATFMATWGAVAPEQLLWRAEKHGLRFAMPVYIFQGAEDINTPTSMAMDYCARIKAPAKACETIPGAGHNTVFFGDEMLALLNKHVRPQLMKRR